MDKFSIDGHKLLYHVGRVNDWLGGGDIYPIYVEIATAGACNHRCTYCALDYVGYQTRFLDAARLKERLSEMGRLGVKSVMYAGEGEPLLHRDIGDIINHTKASGIDVAITSNAVAFTPRLIESSLGSITWIKISMNAGTAETYSKIHRTRQEDFDRVLGNIRHAIKVRAERKLPATIGMQMILLPENAHEATLLARTARDIGADYLVIKPYSHHHKSETSVYRDIDYRPYYALADELDALSSDAFSVIFRLRTMKKLEDAERGYCRCLAIPFWSYVDAGGGLWACSAYLGDERFYLGNVMEKGFEDVWKGERRKKAMRFVNEELDASECRQNCRMDEINRYLWGLKNPPGHVNFI